MADAPATYQSPFQKAAEEAAKARAAAAGKAAPSASSSGIPAGAPDARGAVAVGKTQSDARAPLLATEAAQYLKTQQARMENARREAERARLRLEAERIKSHHFIKKQELARVATRLRAAESSLVAAEADERRAVAALGNSAGAIHEKSSGRARLATDREALERDYERRENGEAKAVAAIEHDMAKLARDEGRDSPRYAELERRRRDREKGLASIRQERVRRRIENGGKDTALARQMAGAERAEQTARRAAELAGSLVAKYRLQVRTFSVARQTLDADLERLGRELAKAEAAARRTTASAPDTFGHESPLA